MSSITIAITGASGSVYGIRLLEVLLNQGFSINLIISPTGMIILKEELGLKWDGEAKDVERRVNEYFKLSSTPRGEDRQIRYFSPDDLLAPISSGSYLQEKMVICPCSMGTLSRISHGYSGNLIERAADVFIKEGRCLVMVPRETPLSLIHLENMLRLSTLGVCMVPAMPAFYHKPEDINDLINFVAGKVLDVLGIENDLYKRWG
ncbi:MAG: UbiX family flavin prenyltransferase [Thermodesulfobacteriota bacterium]